MEPLGPSVNALSQAIKVPRTRLNNIVRGRRGITADSAIRLARYFGVSARFWMNLQTHYELEAAEESWGDKLVEKSGRTPPDYRASRPLPVSEKDWKHN